MREFKGLLGWELKGLLGWEFKELLGLVGIQSITWKGIQRSGICEEDRRSWIGI